jgi:hypothetical protein
MFTYSKFIDFFICEAFQFEFCFPMTIDRLIENFFQWEGEGVIYDHFCDTQIIFIHLRNELELSQLLNTT